MIIAILQAANSDVHAVARDDSATGNSDKTSGQRRILSFLAHTGSRDFGLT